MRQQSFKEWMANGGDDIYESILDWLENVPEEIDLRELIGCDNDEYAYGECESRYESELSGYGDYLYEQERDRQMEEEHE